MQRRRLAASFYKPWCFFGCSYLLGQEGCRSNLQQRAAETNWEPLAGARSHLRQTGRPHSSVQGVTTTAAVPLFCNPTLTVLDLWFINTFQENCDLLARKEAIDPNPPQFSKILFALLEDLED